MKNVSIQKIANKLGISVEKEFLVSGYQIDSRQVKEGDLFFALKGERSDGHEHLREVREKGALAAIVSSEYAGEDFGLELLRVQDVLSTLQDLARFSIAEEKSLQLIGVTGSVGKTTTKEFIATILEGKFKTGKNERSYNSKLTYPLTILNRDAGLEVLVVEMGMSDPGDIGKLVSIAAPDIAVLTKVGLAHAAFFPGGVPEIAKYKAEIFSHEKTRLAIFDHALHQYPSVVDAIDKEKVTFSLENSSADYFLSAHEGKFLIDERGVRAHGFDLPFSQSHILHNFLAAVSVARAMKMQWEEINQRIGFLKLPEMRFEQFEKKGISFINDAYNANPESMRAALSHLPEPKEGGKKIAVLGTMCDLGIFSETSHQEIGRFAQKYVDHLLVLGMDASPLCEAFQEVKKPAELFVSRENLALRLKQLMSFGDVVLIKGSRAMKLENIFELLD